MTDDQRWDTICLPNNVSEICNILKESPMPFLQKNIVEKGVVYANAFVTNPACCPARTSLLSGGFYSPNIGVLTNRLPNGGASLFGNGQSNGIDQTTLATILQENGYKTALIGKYLNQYSELLVNHSSAYIPPGWDDFIVRITGGSEWHEPHYVIGHNEKFVKIEKLKGYVPSIENQKAIDFIEKNCKNGKCDKPFFLFLSSIIPHTPIRGDPNHPEDREFVSNFMYEGRGWIAEAESFCKNNVPISVKDKPKYVINKIQGTLKQSSPGHAGVSFCEFYEQKGFETLARDQLQALRILDRNLSEIYKKLEKMELLDQTIIIFASDNGYLWGEHGLWAKFLPYEESIRVPLVIRLPSQDHKIVNDMVAFDLDIPPTILEIAGIKHDIIELSDGISLMPTFNQTWNKLRDEMFFQSFTPTDSVRPQFSALRIFLENEKGEMELWKFIEYTTGEIELYNLSNDKYEINNLHSNTILVNLLSEKLDKYKGTVINRKNFPDPYSIFLPNAVEGELYSFQLVAEGGNGEYSWNFYKDDYHFCEKVDKIPSWVNLETFKETGLISGMVKLNENKKNSYNLCIKVNDSSQSPHPEKSSPQSFVIPLILNITKE